MRKLGLDNHASYLARLDSDSKECRLLLDTIGINVSGFFRNTFVFEMIRKQILPAIMDFKRSSSSRELRIWSAGCGAGEEAYSIAILLHMALEDEEEEWTPYIFATDMDERALIRAGEGLYPRESLKDTRLGIVDACFSKLDEEYQVLPRIQRMVRFSRHDLTSPKYAFPPDSIFGSFDLVLCRNVLIYFSQEMVGDIFERLHKSLASGGFLVLGESEALDRKSEKRLSTVDAANRIYRKA